MQQSVVTNISYRIEGAEEELCNIRNIIPEDINERQSTSDQYLLNVHQDQLE